MQSTMSRANYCSPVSIGVGFLFSLGHSTIALAATAGIATRTRQARKILGFDTGLLSNFCSDKVLQIRSPMRHVGPRNPKFRVSDECQSSVQFGCFLLFHF